MPGLTPHPVNHPAGHLFGHQGFALTAACRELPTSWNECAEYLYGVDLFNRAYLWEAHEAWEAVWIAAGKTRPPAMFVQGLIQIAAALLRQHLGTPDGARNLLARAHRRLAPVEADLVAAGKSTYLGIQIGPWKQAVERFLMTDSAPYPFLRLDLPR